MLSSKITPEVTIQKYRLAPTDLPRGQTDVYITSVAVVGLERLTLLFYLDRFAKPLAISGEQAKSLTVALTQATGRSTFQNWVGHIVTLQTVTVDDEQIIVATPVLDAAAQPQPQPRTPRLATFTAASHRSSVLTAIVLVIVLVLALLAVFWIENSETLGQLFTR